MSAVRPAWGSTCGGTQFVLEAQDATQREVDADAVGRTLEVLRRRVDQLGLAEPALQAGRRRGGRGSTELAGAL